MSDKNSPEVVLIFPPLVETNFGNYYPSTAVLSGFLRSYGVEVGQIDLNERFALSLLEEDHLISLGAGIPHYLESIEKHAMPAAAARLLMRFKPNLFDDYGRHNFRGEIVSEGYLLSLVAQVYRIDLRISDLLQPQFFESPEARVFKRFYENCQFSETLPPDLKVVGISVPMGPQLAPALILADVIKSLKPDVVIVLGGPVFSLMNLEDLERLLVRFLSISAVVRFDGEEPLLKIIELARKGEVDFTSVPGVSSFISHTASHCAPTAGIALDQLPFADYDPNLMECLANPEIGIVQARGCYWGKCSYCDFVELYEGSPPFRTRTVPRFVDEIEFQVKKHGDFEISIITESIPPAFARKMSEEIIQRNLKIRWNSFVMVEKRFTRQTFELMSKSGCSHVCLGMETMNDRVLMLVNKAGRQSENIRFINDARAQGIKLRVNLIPNLPSMTYSESMESLSSIEDIADCVDSFAVFPFEPTRSSAVGRNPEKFGLITKTGQKVDSAQAQYAENHLDSHDPAMSEDQRTAAIEAYRYFADRSNAAREQARAGLPLSGSFGPPYVLDTHSADWVEGEQYLHYFNYLTRERLFLSSDWKDIFDALKGKSFQLSDLDNLIGSKKEAEDVLGHMLDFNMLKSETQ